MKNLFHHLLFGALLLSASTSNACDADVLRLNYRRTPANKPVVKPTSPSPKVAEGRRASITLSAYMKLEPR